MASVLRFSAQCVAICCRDRQEERREGGRGERGVKKEEVSEEVGKEELGISKNEQGEVDKLFISYHLRVCL